jgi:hypothetical protein
MPGKRRGGKATPVWTVVVVPAGTVVEAEAAARRAQRLVAGWIQAGAAQPVGREC